MLQPKNVSNLNFVSFSIVSIIYIITNPIRLFTNLFKGINNKTLTTKYIHAPIYFIKTKKFLFEFKIDFNKLLGQNRPTFKQKLCIKVCMNEKLNVLPKGK